MQSGDTFYEIALRVYDDPDMRQQIAAVNGLDTDFHPSGRPGAATAEGPLTFRRVAGRTRTKLGSIVPANRRGITGKSSVRTYR